MADLIRFVDSIDAAPTVRLDLNDEVSFWVRSFSAPPPRLRRSMASNAMRDGIHVGSAAYDGRTLTMEIELRRSGQDAAATDIQNLWRELDRESNWIMYQPQGASKPVFFRTFRSDASALEDVMAQAAMRRATVELLAEPFALGLVETASAGDTYANAAAETEGNNLDRPLTAIGDVPAPLMLWTTTDNITNSLLLVAGRGESTVFEAETGGSGINTLAVGADATYSNSAGKTVSFATTTGMATRVDPRFFTLSPGSYRIVGRFKKSVAADDIAVRVTIGSMSLDHTAAMASTTEFQIVDFGTFTLDAPVGYNLGSSASIPIEIEAQRVSGTGTLGIDFLDILPCETTAIVTVPDTANTVVLDAINDAVYTISTTSPFDAGATQFPHLYSGPAQWAGALPSIHPNDTNNLAVIRLGACAKTVTTTVAAAYWPRYLLVRPTAS